MGPSLATNNADSYTLSPLKTSCDQRRSPSSEQLGAGPSDIRSQNFSMQPGRQASNAHQPSFERDSFHQPLGWSLCFVIRYIHARFSCVSVFIMLIQRHETCADSSQASLQPRQLKKLQLSDASASLTSLQFSFVTSYLEVMK